MPEDDIDDANYFGFKSKEQEENDAEKAKEAYKAMLWEQIEDVKHRKEEEKRWKFQEDIIEEEWVKKELELMNKNYHD